MFQLNSIKLIFGNAASRVPPKIYLSNFFLENQNSTVYNPQSFAPKLKLKLQAGVQLLSTISQR